MLKKFILIGLMLGVFLVPLSQTGFAKDKRFDDMVQKLDLSKSQVQQMKTLKDKYFDKGDRKAKRNQMRELHQKLHQAFASETVDQAQVDQYKNQIIRLMTERVNRRIEHLKELREILTVDQFKKLEGLKKKQMEGKKGPQWDSDE